MKAFSTSMKVARMSRPVAEATIKLNRVLNAGLTAKEWKKYSTFQRDSGIAMSALAFTGTRAIASGKPRLDPS